MKKILVSTTTWMLAGFLAVTLNPGQADSTNIEGRQKIGGSPSNVQLGQLQKARNPQSATNAKGTLFGQNEGDFIILQWDLNDNATEYFVYRSTSLNGPWEQTGRFSQGAARTGGAKVIDTPDARLMDLCFKVEAIDATGVVIEFYEPICVPKFAP